MSEERSHLLPSQTPQSDTDTFRCNMLGILVACLATIGLVSLVVSQSFTSLNNIIGTDVSRMFQSDANSLSEVWKIVYEELKQSHRIANKKMNVEFSLLTENGQAIARNEFVSVKELQNPPTIVIQSDSPLEDHHEYYTWILIDVDAPDPNDPKHAPFLHYIVVNVDPNEPLQQKTEVSYFPVSPKKGRHAYYSLLLKQMSGMYASNDLILSPDVTERSNFNVNAFAEKRNLVLYGFFVFKSNK